MTQDHATVQLRTMHMDGHLALAGTPNFFHDLEVINVADEVNLELDIDESGPHGSGDRMVRVAVRSARGFTRDGASPTITVDCRTYAGFEREIERLKEELNDTLGQAAAHFDATRKDQTETRKAQRSSVESERGEKARLMANLKVREVMTVSVRTVNENDRLSMAEELMKLGQFRHVVVLDDDGQVAGVVSHRDIFFSAITWSTGQGRHAHEQILDSLPVKQVMNSTLHTVAPETELAEAASTMINGKIGCLPVMEGEKLVGILTEGDFLALIM